jgi:hypothetical protein
VTGIARLSRHDYTTNYLDTSSIFWDITPCSLLKINRRFAFMFNLCLPPAFTSVSCLAYSSVLKMEVTCSFEITADFQRTTRHYIPEQRTLHNHRCENLKSSTI